MGEDGATSHAGPSDGASVAAAAPRRRPPSTGLTLPLLAALIVGVIASFGVAIVGTLLTEPLASAPTESGPYVTEPDGTMKLARGWIWPAPKEWGEPDEYQIQRNWLTTSERASSETVVDVIDVTPFPELAKPGQKPPARIRLHPTQPYEQRVIRCGWPASTFEVRDPPESAGELRQFSIASWRFDYDPARSTLLIVSTKPQVPGPIQLAREMPTRVYWPGLVSNTIFFGVLFLVMFILPGRAKVARRRRFGLCLACGYDLAGLAMCPECGLAASREIPAHAPAAPSPVP